MYLQLLVFSTSSLVMTSSKSGARIMGISMVLMTAVVFGWWTSGLCEGEARGEGKGEGNGVAVAKAKARATKKPNRIILLVGFMLASNSSLERFYNEMETKDTNLGSSSKEKLQRLWTNAYEKNGAKRVAIAWTTCWKLNFVPPFNFLYNFSCMPCVPPTRVLVAKLVILEQCPKQSIISDASFMTLCDCSSSLQHARRCILSYPILAVSMWILSYSHRSHVHELNVKTKTKKRQNKKKRNKHPKLCCSHAAIWNKDDHLNTHNPFSTLPKKITLIHL